MSKLEYQQKQWSEEAGTCIHCVSSDIDYPESKVHDIDGDCLYYNYVCLDCGNSGREVYAVQFVENKATFD